MHYIGIQQQDHLICEVIVHGTTVTVLDKSFIEPPPPPPPPPGVFILKTNWGGGGLNREGGLI